MSMPPRYEQPQSSEYAPYYHTYVGKVEGDVLSVLESQPARFDQLLGGLPESRADHAYAPGKWSIKQVIGHINDAERVFAYRALVFGRNDSASLPSFDENAWMAPAAFERRTLADLIGEFKAIRESTLGLLRHLPQDAVTRIGTASGKQVSVRALAYIMAGHVTHHANVLAEKYL
jgi:hypothetical protein